MTTQTITKDDIKRYAQAYADALSMHAGLSKSKRFQKATGCAAQAVPVVHDALRTYADVLVKLPHDRTEQDWLVLEAVKAKSAVTRGVTKALKNGKSAVINLDDDDEAMTDEEIAELPMSQLYKRLVDTFDYVPCDKIMVWLTGYKPQTFANIRAGLKAQGYIFDATDDGWRVGSRPEVDPKTQQILALRKQLRQQQAQMQAIQDQLSQLAQ